MKIDISNKDLKEFNVIEYCKENNINIEDVDILYCNDNKLETLDV